MPAKITPPSFDAVQQKLTEMGFTATRLSDGHVLVRKDGCAAVLAPEGRGVAIAAAPGRIVGGQLARLVDRGYQKFFKSADNEVPALPEDMTALAGFESQLRYACGAPSLYNESLGSVSDRYLYDRVWYRDQGRQPKPWEQDAAHALHQSNA
ncbi:MAG TPA: hypothetical protein VIC32_08875 [Terriglobales bacterium]|jgi:hypothetical protein